MASIERTAYPRFSRVFTSRELQDVYTPSVEDILFARLQIRNDAARRIAVLCAAGPFRRTTAPALVIATGAEYSTIVLP
jgi:hypothetical protein